MVSFFVYDIAFLVVFTVATIVFLKTRKHNLSREGIIFMFRTQAGVTAIHKFAKKFAKPLHAIKYLVISVGYVLMAAMLWMLGQTLWLYISVPQITDVIKAPPIAPLIPYFPKLFGLQSFFPPFYFTYFIVALAIVAVVHEFSHGIYMSLFKTKIKSTCLVFLGPILGAFVEEEKSNFYKKKNSEQMVVLAAGVFANTLFALIFYLLYVGFFLSSFTPSGYIFTNYGVDVISVNAITGIEDVSLTSGNVTKVSVGEVDYYLDEGLAIQLDIEGLEQLVVYPEAPAVLAGLKGAIVSADDIAISDHKGLIAFLESKSPGDTVTFMTEHDDGSLNNYVVTLASHPSDESKAYLGVGHQSSSPSGIIQKFLSSFMSFKDPSTYYKPSWDGDFTYFILHLLWWVMIINLLVALFNMLPLGILDGGRFFYLTALSLTGSKKAAKRAYKWVGYAIVGSFIVMMLYWGIRII